MHNFSDIELDQLTLLLKACFAFLNTGPGLLTPAGICSIQAGKFQHISFLGFTSSIVHQVPIPAPELTCMSTNTERSMLVLFNHYSFCS